MWACRIGARQVLNPDANFGVIRGNDTVDVMTDDTAFEAVALTPLIGTEVKTDAESLANGRFTRKIRELLEQRGF
jgi:hypothetical protein